MTLNVLQDFFFWSFLSNSGFLLLWFFVVFAAGDWIYRLHNSMFPMSRQAFTTIHYAGMLAYKMGIILFNFVPYLALYIAAA